MVREGEALLPFNYKSPLPNDCKGINVIIVGDHGDITFRYHVMFQFSSPTTRKDLRQLSFRCQKVQLGFIECRNETYDVLANTIARPLRSSLEKLRRSSLIVQSSIIVPINCCSNNTVNIILTVVSTFFNDRRHFYHA
jgi:hypothetical protein